MKCPIPGCGGETKVVYTKAGPKMIMRRRACLSCDTRFVTQERTLRITADGGPHGKDSKTARIR